MFNIADFYKDKGSKKVAIVGLGYVGLPLAILFNSKFNVIGFDIKQERIKELTKNFDRTNEISEESLKNCTINFTNDPRELNNADVVCITVPTPIDEHKNPDLTPILGASGIVGENLKKGGIIVYESTVYPGLTEEECIPIIEKRSGLKWKKDFFVGYSPERVNPGDKEHTIDKIQKIVSGDTSQTLDFLSDLYASVVVAGIHKAENIKTAEAAKVIENTQRDLNIALMNELAIIFNKMGINTLSVIKAASTKWNFLKFEPGLVGGHCIGVDPYYLTFKAKEIGFYPETILAGRKINDYMGKFVAENTLKNLIKLGKSLKSCKVLILGLTFKENIKDIRNTKVTDIYHELKDYGIETFIYDPYADMDEVKNILKIDLITNVETFKPYDAVVFAVKHKFFNDNFSLEKLIKIMSPNPVLIDVKNFYKKEDAEKIGYIYWSL